MIQTPNLDRVCKPHRMVRWNDDEPPSDDYDFFEEWCCEDAERSAEFEAAYDLAHYGETEDERNEGWERLDDLAHDFLGECEPDYEDYYEQRDPLEQWAPIGWR